MTVAPGDFVKVTYHGRDARQYDQTFARDNETPFVFEWDSRKYPVGVGQEVFMPFDAMANVCGDPRAGSSMRSYKDEAGNVGFILDRATEVRRLRLLHDSRGADETSIPNAPEVTVTDLEGNEVVTVLNDPTGETVHPITTTASDKTALEAQIQKMQRTIEILAQQQGLDLAANPNLVANEAIEPATSSSTSSVNHDDFVAEEPTILPEDK